MAHKKTNDIPSWIFFAVDSALGHPLKWNQDKQKLAQELTKNLKDKAQFYSWPKEVIEHVFKYEPHDSIEGYMQHPRIGP